MLLTDNVLKWYKPEPWHEFRTRELWANEPNDVIELNLDTINKVYRDLTSTKGKSGKIVLRKTLDLVTTKAPIVLRGDAIHCLGMSKMTVLDEIAKDGMKKYNVITREEFYEFIARLADFKYKELEDDTLAMKIERILDLILPVYNLKRKIVECEDVKHYSSDDSVDYESVPTDLRLRT